MLGLPNLGLNSVQVPLEARIASLFANGEEGAWYDPSDLSTLFQDSAGTTPVTALGQPVGLMLDKSKGLVRGPELVVGGDFSGTLSAQFKPHSDTSLSIENGRLKMTADRGAFYFASAYLDCGLTSGKTYEIRLDYETRNDGIYEVKYPDNGTVLATLPKNTVGTVRIVLQAMASDRLYLRNALPTAIPGAYWFIDNISVRELPGNHARQLTGTARPKLAAGYKIDFDGVDDLLTTTFPGLGSNVTIVRSVPGTGASILTGQTIGAGARDDSTDHHGLLIINRALTAPETALVTRWANMRAGV